MTTPRLCLHYHHHHHQYQTHCHCDDCCGQELWEAAQPATEVEEVTRAAKWVKRVPLARWERQCLGAHHAVLPPRHDPRHHWLQLHPLHPLHHPSGALPWCGQRRCLPHAARVSWPLWQRHQVL